MSDEKLLTNRPFQSKRRTLVIISYGDEGKIKGERFKNNMIWASMFRPEDIYETFHNEGFAQMKTKLIEIFEEISWWGRGGNRDHKVKKVKTHLLHINNANHS